MLYLRKLTREIFPKKFFATAIITITMTALSCQLAHAQNLDDSTEYVSVEEVSDENQYFTGSAPEQVESVDMLDEEQGVDTIVDEVMDAGESSQEYLNDNFLLLKVTSSKLILNNGLSAYQLDDRLYLSLFELVDTLYFPIEVFDEDKTAEGWFIEKDNDFYLNVEQEQLIIKGREVEYDKEDLQIIDEEIYISSTALNDWFGVSFDLNFSRLTLDIESTEKLAFEKQIEREERWRQKESSKKGKIAEYEELAFPYKFAEIPSTTVVLGTNYLGSNGNQIADGNYSIQGSGDFLGMSSDFFISGNDDAAVSDSRVRLYRYDENGVIDGTDIKQVEIGDISPGRLNLVGGGGTERGIKFTNKSEGETTTPDNLLIEGEVEPGFEVELYRNGEFIAFINDTSSGRFEFSGLTLEAGLNLYRIVKYGPFGEVEEEFRRYFIGEGLLKEGEVKYEVSATQVGQSLLPTTSGDFSLSGDQRIVASADYGVTDEFAIGGGFYSGPILEEQRNAVLLSSRASVLGTYNVLDYLANDDSTSITAFSNRMSFSDFNISSFATYYGGFDSAEIDTLLDSNIDVSTNFNLFDLTSLNFRVGAEYETFQSGGTRYGYTNQISTIVQGFVLSNRLNWDILESAGGDKTRSTTGEFFFRKRFDDFVFNERRDILLTTNASYKLEPEATLDSMNLTLEQDILNDTRLELGLSQTFGDTDITTYSLGVNQSHEYYLMGVGASYTSEGDIRVGLNLRFNVGADYSDGGDGEFGFIKNEQAQRGSVEAFVFLDNNSNGEFDKGDEPIEDVVLKSRFGIRGKTNNNGTAYLSGFAGYKTDSVSLEYTSLPDIFYVPMSDGYTITPRPGNKSYIEFPVVIGGEIDGQITLNSDYRNSRFDFSKFVVELVNTEGKVVKEVRADQTGFYIFERVIPADYTLRLKAEAVAENDFVGQIEQEVRFEKDEPVVTGIDFIGDLQADLDAAAEQEEITDITP